METRSNHRFVGNVSLSPNGLWALSSGALVQTTEIADSFKACLRKSRQFKDGGERKRLNRSSADGQQSGGEKTDVSRPSNTKDIEKHVFEKEKIGNLLQASIESPGLRSALCCVSHSQRAKQLSQQTRARELLRLIERCAKRMLLDEAVGGISEVCMELGDDQPNELVLILKSVGEKGGWQLFARCAYSDFSDALVNEMPLLQDRFFATQLGDIELSVELLS